MEMQGNATEIDERNLLQLDALLSHGYGLSPQLVMRSKGLSIEAKALYGYLSSFAGAGDTAFPSTSRILEELDISKNRFYKIRKELISWGFISIETTATSAGLRTVYTLPQNPIAIKTEIDEIANRRNEIKSSLVANLHNEDMVSHKGDSESERLQQSAGNEPCRQSEAKAQNRGSNLKPCLQSEDEGCLQSGDKLYIDTSINPKVSIDRSATRPSDDEVPSNWKVIEGMTDTTLESYQASRRKEVPRMNEMQAHGLLIPVGSKPFEVWIDKNNSLAELQDLVNGNVDVLSILGNGVDLWVNEEGLINGSKPNRAIYATKHMEEVGYLDQLTFGHPVKEGELYSLICGDFVAFGVDEEGEIASLPQETIDKLKETFADPSTGYKEYIHIKYGIEPDRYQLQNEHAPGDKHEKSTMSLAEAAKEARENSMALNHSKGNHDDSGSDIGNSRPIDREYPISH